MRTAVIGIGSNSVRMLEAEISGSAGVRLRRDRAATRLFAGLDAQGRLSPEAMAATAEAVGRMADDARAAGAGEVLLFATSATRDAANSGDFALLLRQRARVEMHICSGEEEAALSYFGARTEGDCGVIDIGGGSTEVVLGSGEDIRTAFSCQMGAVRLFRRVPIDSAAAIPEVIALAEEILSEKLAAEQSLRLPERWVGVGGTFTTLGAMMLGVPWTDRSRLNGAALSRSCVTRCASELADMPLEERKKIPGLQPGRADIIVHGICILIACMQKMGIPVIYVSECGNLDGFLRRHYGLATLL